MKMLISRVLSRTVPKKLQRLSPSFATQFLSPNKFGRGSSEIPFFMRHAAFISSSPLISAKPNLKKTSDINPQYLATKEEVEQMKLSIQQLNLKRLKLKELKLEEEVQQLKLELRIDEEHEENNEENDEESEENGEKNGALSSSSSKLPKPDSEETTDINQSVTREEVEEMKLSIQQLKLKQTKLEEDVEELKIELGIDVEYEENDVESKEN